MTTVIAVADAYRECEEITTQQARNFSWGIRLLPPTKRRALSAVYAMARRIDDIGDGTLADDEKLRRLAEVRRIAEDPSTAPDDPVAVALRDAARQLPIPLQAFGDLVDGCEMDVRGRDYKDFDDLVEYCRCVAGSIGRLSLGVFAPALDNASSARADELADALGVALQLTNILRDVREDSRLGRVYLPATDLALFGCRVTETADGTIDPQDGAMAELIRFEAARAWGWYDRGLQLLPLLDRRSAACCAAMAGIYRQVLIHIATDPDVVLRDRASLSARQKLAVAVRALARPGSGGAHA